MTTYRTVRFKAERRYPDLSLGEADSNTKHLIISVLGQQVRHVFERDDHLQHELVFSRVVYQNYITHGVNRDHSPVILARSAGPLGMIYKYASCKTFSHIESRFTHIRSRYFYKKFDKSKCCEWTIYYYCLYSMHFWILWKYFIYPDN